MHAQGFVNAYEHCSPGTQAYSWIGRTGAGYCYGYFHMGAALADRIGDCAYPHETRELDLALDAVRLPYGNLAEPDEITLF